MSREGNLQGRFEIMAHWRPLVEAAGMYSGQHTPENVFLLAGAIMKDPIVSVRAFAPPDKIDYLGTVLAFTPEEKEALAERIRRRYAK